MKYNAKYDRWVSKDGLVYRYDKKNDKLVLCSEFGRKYKEHFGIGCYENCKQYQVEHHWYRTHNKVCRWEVEDKCK